MLSRDDMPSPLVIESPTKAQFENELQTMGKPFVIKNFATHWNIVKQTNSSVDALHYLADRINQTQQQIPTVRIPVLEKSRMFYNTEFDGMNFDAANLPLERCLQLMYQTAKLNDAVKVADYAAQCTSVAHYFPKLASELSNPLISPEVEPFIWFGNKVIVAPHFDESDNIAVVASGRRRFTLFPPEQTKNLYIGPIDFTPSGQAISLVNIVEPDLTRFPRYEEAAKHAFSVELAVGDAIYIPTPWWHHVESLSSFNVLINYWWNQTNMGTAKPFAAILHTMQALKTMPPVQKEHFKALLNYYVFDDPEQTYKHIPEHARGWLSELSQEKREELDHFIKAFSK